VPYAVLNEQVGEQCSAVLRRPPTISVICHPHQVSPSGAPRCAEDKLFIDAEPQRPHFLDRMVRAHVEGAVRAEQDVLRPA